MVKRGISKLLPPLLIITSILSTSCADEYATIGAGLESATGVTSGVMERVAGMPGGMGTSDGTGIDVRFGSPKGVAAYRGLLYVADQGNHTLRELNIRNTTVRTIAGRPEVPGVSDGYYGEARFNALGGVATDGSYIFITDTGNHVIRKMDIVNGYVSTLAGRRGQPGYNDSSDATGTTARFRGPTALTVFGDFLYVADTLNNTIRRVNKHTGETITIAGKPGEYGDTDGPVRDARFDRPGGITTDGENIYVADTFNHTIRMVDLKEMTVSTIAGISGDYGYMDGEALLSKFIYPSGIEIRGLGLYSELYIADYGNCVIRKMNLDTRIVVTLSGVAGKCGYTDGPSDMALFNGPEWLVLVGDYLYVSDNLNLSIRRVKTATGEVITFAGRPPGGGSQDGMGETARFDTPGGIAMDGDILYVTDTGNHAIRKIDQETDMVSTYAGNPGRPGSTDSDESPAFFSYPYDIAADEMGKYLYVTERGNHIIRKINLSTGEVRTYAGYPGKTGTNDGTGTEARFNSPAGVLRIGDMLYAADSSNHAIRRIDMMTGAVSTTAGTSGIEGASDSTQATPASFRSPSDITTDGRYLYVADGGNHAIRRVDPETGIVKTIAGVLGQSGLVDSKDGAPQFNSPSGIVWLSNSLYVADTLNHVMRRVDLMSGEVSTLAGDVECVRETEIIREEEQEGAPLVAARLVEKLVCSGMPTGVSKYAGDSTDGTGKTTSFNSPSGINTDGLYLYVVDTDNNKVRRVSPDTGETISINARPVKGSSFNKPTGGGIIDNLFYIADSENHAVRVLDISDIENAPLRTIAGNIGVSGYGYSSGYDARFNGPVGIAVDKMGNVYVSDTGNHIIRKIDAVTAKVSTVAGVPLQKGFLNTEFGNPRFNSPRGISVDEKNLYVADTGNHVIRRINLATGYVGLVAGQGDIRTQTGTPGTADSTGAAAGFNGPRGITADDLYLYVTDTGNHTIRRVLKATGQVKTLAGMPKESGYRDGVSFDARFNAPRGVTADGDFLYVADTVNNVVRRVNKYTGGVITLSGAAGQSSSVPGERDIARYGSITGITTAPYTPWLFLTDSSENVAIMVEK